jgi:L-ascorbate metabolism protein UlaG (beta-lactamase superfamily)
MQWDVTTSEEEAQDRIRRTIRYQKNGGLSFIVTKDGEPIGFAGVIETEPGVYEDTGGCLGPEFQRKGYGRQMLAALERLVFSLGAEKFIVAHRRENLPSKKVILARGFRYTHSEEKDYGILDFYEKRRSDMEVKLTYHGHACFTLEYQGAKAVIDPYAAGCVPGQPDLHMVVDALYCSHDHADHNFREAVGLHLSLKPQPYTLTEFVTPHDDRGGALRGMNTVRIFDFDGLRVAHLGDIGCFPDEELTKALTGVDCLLIPVGGTYTIGTQTAYQIIRTLKPRVAIPMHYRTDKTGFDVLSHIDDFLKLWGSDSPRIITLDVNQHVHINK